MPRHLALLRLAGLALITVLLNACGGGGGGDSAPVSVDSSYMPLAVGDRWVYSTGDTDSTQQNLYNARPELHVISGTETINAAPALVYQVWDIGYGSVTDERYYSLTSTALTQLYKPGSQPITHQTSSTLLHFPLTVGDSYVADQLNGIDLGADFDGDGKDETQDITTQVQVVGFEDVTVAAGTFHALKVVITTTSTTHYTASGLSRSSSVHLTHWLAKDIGDVKIVQQQDSPMTPLVAWQLQAFAVDGKRSDYTPPEVATATPTVAGTNNAWTTISVTFSEAADVFTSINQTAIVTDDRGNAISGTANLNIDGFYFTPDAPLPSGTYFVKITNLSDLIGNVLPTASLMFSVDTSQAGDPDNYFPLAVGNRWVYNVTGSHYKTTYPQSTDMIAGQREETITGTDTVGGITGYVDQEADPASGTVVEQHTLAKNDIAVLELFDPGKAPYGVDLQQLIREHFPLFDRSNFSPNEQQPLTLDAGVDLDGDGINETVSIGYIAQVLSGGPVTVTAGTFPQSFELIENFRATLNYSKGGSTGYRENVTDWRAPGVGVVKRTKVFATDTYTETLNYDLTEYRVDGVSSETAAPTISSDAPAAYTITRSPGIKANFSETLDLGRLGELTFVVTDSLGNTINGTLSSSSQQIVFTPAQPMADGTYTVTVSNAFDLLGNALAPFTWSFVVDATPPVVTGTTPLNGSTQVSTYDDITVDFSKPMQAANALDLSGSSPPVQVSGIAGPNLLASMSGSRLDIKAPLLAHGTTYTVTAGPTLADSHGLAMASPYTFSFTTLAAVVADPVDFFDTFGKIDAAAIGDVNGDGRPDLVLASGLSNSLSNTDQFTLFVFIQNADGTLAAPVTTSTNDYPGYGPDCIPSGLAIADVTGDGKADIVLGEGSCGFKVFQRMADGSWPRPPETSSANSYDMHLLDMNGDGLPDVVAFSYDRSSMSIWYGQTGGGLGPETVVALPAGIMEFPSFIGIQQRLAVGDVTGDGRPDIVFIKLHGNDTSDQYIGVIAQQAGGTFAAPVYYDVATWTYGVDQLAVGDLDNDGRNDVALTSTAGVGILHQQADGTLGAVAYLPATPFPYSLHIADMNHDGRNDLVVGEEGTISLLLQQSDGSFAKEDRYKGNPVLATGDLTGDGKPDLVVIPTSYSQISIMTNVWP